MYTTYITLFCMIFQTWTMGRHKPFVKRLNLDIFSLLVLLLKYFYKPISSKNSHRKVDKKNRYTKS